MDRFLDVADVLGLDLVLMHKVTRRVRGEELTSQIGLTFTF